MVCSPQVFCRALRSRGDQLLRLMTAQQVRCDLNEDAGGCGEHSAVRAAQFGGAAMLAAAFAFGPAFEQKRTLEWDGPEVVDGQVTRHRGDVAMTVGFAHGFIEQRGNNAAVRMARRSLELPGEMYTAENALLVIDEELEVEAGMVVVAATETGVQRSVRYGGFACGCAFTHAVSVHHAGIRRDAVLRYTRIQIWR